LAGFTSFATVGDPKNRTGRLARPMNLPRFILNPVTWLTLIDRCRSAAARRTPQPRSSM
jgi:hypothetical protein